MAELGRTPFVVVSGWTMSVLPQAESALSGRGPSFSRGALSSLITAAVVIAAGGDAGLCHGCIVFV